MASIEIFNLKKRAKPRKDTILELAKKIKIKKGLKRSLLKYGMVLLCFLFIIILQYTNNKSSLCHLFFGRCVKS